MIKTPMMEGTSCWVIYDHSAHEFVADKYKTHSPYSWTEYLYHAKRFETPQEALDYMKANYNSNELSPRKVECGLRMV